MGRERELRSALRFAPAITRPTFVISAAVSDLVAADELAELSHGAARAVACPHGATCDAALLVALLRDHALDRGAVSITSADLATGSAIVDEWQLSRRRSPSKKDVYASNR